VASVLDGRVFARFTVALLEQRDAFEQAVKQVIELARRLSIPRETIAERLLANFRAEDRDDLRLRFLDTLLHTFGPNGPGGVAAREGARDRDPRVRLRAANALGAAGYDVLERLVTDETVVEDVRIQALRSLVLAAPGRGRRVVVGLLQSNASAALRRAAIELAGRPLGVTEALQTIALMAEGSDSLTAAAVARTLGLLGSPEAEPPLLALLQRPELDVKLAAARALGEVGTIRAVETLLELSQHRGIDSTLREVAGEALARIQAQLGPAERGRLSVVDPAELGGNLSLASEAGAGALSVEAEEEAETASEKWPRQPGRESEAPVDAESAVEE
jgi:HEAT repeat protein